MTERFTPRRGAPLFTPAGPPDLRCPGCGGANLHHHCVDVYVRAREDAAAKRLRVTPDGEVEVEPNAIGNPSRRRNGVSIWLACEVCDALSRLDIAQHQGATDVTLAVVAQAPQPLHTKRPFVKDDRP